MERPSHHQIQRKAHASWITVPALGTVFFASSALTGQNPPSTPTAPNMPVTTTPQPDMNNNDRRDDITRTDLVDMSHFLNSHPEIYEQLRKDPSLIDNRRWVAEHPALQQYLHEHPQIADAFRANPNAFMSDEHRYDRDYVTRTDIVDMSHFLNQHPEIAEQLRKDPSLIDNRRWVDEHPALQQYLHEHPQIADSFRTNPDAFMRDEERYDRDHGQMAFDRDERNRREFTGFGEFLGSHSSIKAELAADPTLCNNKEYLASHAELNEYLQAHPTLSQQLAQNPQGVMSSNWVQENGTNSFGSKPTETKPKSIPNQ